MDAPCIPSEIPSHIHAEIERAFSLCDPPYTKESPLPEDMGSMEVEKKIVFTEVPLGIRLQQKDLDPDDPNTSVTQVEEILRETPATKKIKPGWILRKIQGIDVTSLTLPVIQQILFSKRNDVSTNTPLILTFLSPTDISPLFNPFLEKKAESQSIYASDQKVAMVNSTDINESITTLPSPEGGAAVSPSGNYSLGFSQTASLNSIVNSALVGGTPPTMAPTWLNANDVINVNDLRKRIINIDSRFRTNLMSSPTDFSFRIEPPIKNAIRVRLASIEFQNTFYVFSKKLRNTVLRLICPPAGSDQYFDISEGNQTSDELINALQSRFDAPGLAPHYQAILDVNSGLVTITNTVLVPFTMNFQTEENLQKPQDWGLGQNLGFRKKYQTGQAEQTTEAIIDVLGCHYLFLQVNDFNNVEHQIEEGNVIHAFAKIILSDNKFTHIFDDTSNFLTKEIIFQQPINLANFQIRLIDKQGQVVDNLCSEWSLALEVTEVMNAKLQDFQRNQLFQKNARF